ncbi:bpX6 domain-containing protein [Tahibacter harae]|uniref:BpX6 domain-containing protein n=1 Tax=Tahibacter harae TaxID=2963937 RepID=A0ABT1QPB0_9GAMM|nr:bpX6 domain-containing protein [Tahibacter harae]MCQ4164116.1 bpX6 domain-containing protein [Tahibacter harae]
MNAPVRQPLWQGCQPVAALWFAAALRDESARERCLLREWQPGARALRFDEGDLLCFAAPVWRDCNQGLGLPLCRHDGVLCSGPLQGGEGASLGEGEIGLIGGAQLHTLALQLGQPLDLSRHLSLADYALRLPFDLDETGAAAPLTGKNPREVLGAKAPPASAAARQFQQLLQRRAAERRKQGGMPQRGPFARWLDRLAGKKPASASATGDGSGKPAPGGIAARRPPARPQRWRTWLSRAIDLTRTGALLGWQQAAYLRKLLGQFENNNLDEALRNALPLGGGGESAGEAFGTPGRRSNLSLSSQRDSGIAINLPEAIHHQLRKLYRQAFERLDRAGRVDEALFVLAELLGARQEALDYLVKHQRAAEAAELALGWDMPAPSIVRLLLLAGDTARALLVARRDDAFAATVGLLEGQHPELAAQLRLEWGRSLVARGDWLAAVETVWPLPSQRELATQWLLAAEKAGAELGARALVQRAVLLPDSLPQQARRLRALHDSAALSSERAALAQALLAAPQRTTALGRLSALLLPAIAADRALGRNTLSGKELDRLARHAGDPLLLADLPPWLTPAAQGEPLLRGNTLLQLAAPAAGLHGVCDIAALGRDRWLVALGETGVAVVDAGGRSVQRYALPAQDLVVADSGLVALALARREGVIQVSRIDLVGQRISDLGSLPLADPGLVFNRRYDGLCWSVAGSRHIRVLDTAAPGLAVLWQVETPGCIVQARYCAAGEDYLVKAPDGFERWVYRGRERRLARREEVVLDSARPVLLEENGTLQLQLVHTADDSHKLLFNPAGSEQQEVLELDPAAAAPTCHHCLAVDGCGLLAALQYGRNLRYLLFHTYRKQRVLELDWPAESPAQVFVRGDSLLFADARGRVVQVHLDSSRTQTFALI